VRWKRAARSAAGPHRALVDQALELVVDLLHLLARQLLGGHAARDPRDERRHGVRVDAPVRADEPRRPGQREHAPDLRLGDGSSVAA
jgi:hypothetical protein